MQAGPRRGERVADRSVLIIGAGLAGLSAGCYAQMNGYTSHIVERHTRAGGVAAAWQRGEYLVDGGIHFVMGQRRDTALHRTYRELGVVPATRFVEMTAYGRFVDERSGRSVDVTADLGRLADDLKAASPGDAGAIDEVIAGARAFRGRDWSEVGMSRPPELLGLRDRLGEMWHLRGAARYFTGRYAASVDDYVQGVADPWLRQFFRSLFLPEVPVWFVLMVLGLLADGQMAFLEGGCRDFVGAIEDRYRDLGGQVTYQADVAEVLVEGDRAVGVRLSDGSELRAAVVVSAADGYSTIYRLLGGRHVSAQVEGRYARWALCRPMVMVSYGVARQFPGEPPFTTVRLERPLVAGGQEIDGLLVRIFNYSQRFAPPGKTVLQVEFEAEWERWAGLHRDDRARYAAEKERVSAEVLERLERHFPGVSSQVEISDVATPYTTWRYTQNYRGAWGGWLMTPQVANERIERTLLGLSNFYMAGQWVMPGGGVGPCLCSGRHVAQLLCHRDGLPFRTALP